MDEQNFVKRKLRLEWHTFTFLPQMAGSNQVPQIIEEFLDPETATSNSDWDRYWSVPERLLDIRWLQSRLNDNFADQGNAFFERIITCEFWLYRVVRTFGEWVSTYEKCLLKMNKEEEKYLWESFWEENGALLELYGGRQSAEEQLTEDGLGDLYRIAKEIQDLRIPDSRKSELLKAARRYTTKVEQTFQWNAEHSVSLKLLPPDARQEFVKAALDFGAKAVDFFTNLKWRKDSSDVEQFRKLAKKIQTVAVDWHPDGEDVRSQEYKDSLWNGIQGVADEICNKINGVDPIKGREPTSIEEVMKRVKDAARQLGLRAKSLNEYAMDGKRCVALLELDGTKVMSFSGFLDCEDEQARNVLMDASDNTGVFDNEILEAFQKIAQSMNAELACFSDGVVNRIKRYLLEPTFQFSGYGPLRSELSAPSPNPSFLKRSYSCCERKILASHNVQSNHRPKNAILHIKFAPCLNCYGALRKWIDDTHVNLRIDYPQPVWR